MRTPDHRDTTPGMGDPTRSDDIDSPGLRSDTAGSGATTDAGGAAVGPAPQARDTSATRPDPDLGSGALGGQLGSAGGGYGSASGAGGSLGSPDGEDVQVQSGPGPQTDWLRSADGEGERGPDR